MLAYQRGAFPGSAAKSATISREQLIRTSVVTSTGMIAGVSTSFVLALLVVIVVLIIVRLTVDAFPLMYWAQAIQPRDAVLAGLGVIGLVLHCVAMFDQPLIDGVRGLDRYATVVNRMGGTSIALYVVPAGLVVAGLHAQRRPVLAFLVAALLAVGITMYDGGALAVHLTSIFASVVMLSAIGALFITEIGGRGRVSDLG